MYNEIDRRNFNCIDMLDYILIEDDVSDFQKAFSLDQQINENYIIFSKIKIKGWLAIIRVFFLYIFFHIDDKKNSDFLNEFIYLLLINEGLIITNSFLSYVHYEYLRFTSQRTFTLNCINIYLDILNNVIFFTWFLYVNTEIVMVRESVELSLHSNKMLTNYIFVLILVGYFNYSKLIFYLIFCIDKKRFNLINIELKEKLYHKYLEMNPLSFDYCSICTGEYLDTDNVITLTCNVKHYFHDECIKEWLKNHTICPLCRIDLNASKNEEHTLKNKKFGF